MMEHRRPAALTFLCWLIIGMSFLVIPFSIADLLSTEPGLTDWREGHRPAANALLVFAMAGMAIGPLSAYFMLRAKDWARWLYVVLVLLDAAAAGFLFAKGELFSPAPLIRAAILSPFVLIIVFLPASNRYFSAGDVPWWKQEEEE